MSTEKEGRYRKGDTVYDIKMGRGTVEDVRNGEDITYPVVARISKGDRLECYTEKGQYLFCDPTCSLLTEEEYLDRKEMSIELTSREKKLLLIGYGHGYEGGQEDSDGQFNLSAGYCDAYLSGLDWLDGAMEDGTIIDFLENKRLKVPDE